MLKKIIKKFLSDVLGYHLVKADIFGQDIFQDALVILKKKSNTVIFDIGANLGDTSLELAAKFSESTIYAFEPDPDTFNKLGLKTGHLKNICTYNLGFGNNNESKRLNINKVSGGNSFLTVSSAIGEFAQGDWTKTIGNVEVPVRTIDDFCIEKRIHSIDLVKIDTQGFEIPILEGASTMISSEKTKLIAIEVLFVELYTKQGYFHEVYEILRNRGFKLVGFYNRFYKTQNPHFLLWCDALFVSDKVC